MGKHNKYGLRLAVCTLIVLISAFVPRAEASATILLEEPYGKLGFFTPTGHVAVYLSGVCADSPLVLRACAAGETGIVLSRYDGINGYDWAAIPLIPYLYAVERPEDVPLFADAKMVASLRDHYRRGHLREIAPDTADGAIPGGNWYELVGSAYDRTSYGFEIETSPKQDAALIRAFNRGAESLTLSRHFTQLRGLREGRSQFLLPQIAASQCGWRYGDHYAQTTGATDGPLQCAASRAAFFEISISADPGQLAAEHCGARCSRIFLPVEEVHGAQRRGQSDFRRVRIRPLRGHRGQPF